MVSKLLTLTHSHHKSPLPKSTYLTCQLHFSQPFSHTSCLIDTQFPHNPKSMQELPATPTSSTTSSSSKLNFQQPKLNPLLWLHGTARNSGHKNLLFVFWLRNPYSRHDRHPHRTEPRLQALYKWSHTHSHHTSPLPKSTYSPCHLHFSQQIHMPAAWLNTDFHLTRNQSWTSFTQCSPLLLPS